MKPKYASAATLVLLVLIAIGYLYQERGGDSTATVPEVPVDTGSGVAGDALAAAAFREQRSDVWLELTGRVEKTLADDEAGSRHQRFVVRLASGQTVLVSHNIDVAPKVPIDRGDRVEFRGEYEWNDRGGIVHWTHHDPRGRLDGGWIRHRGKSYR